MTESESSQSTDPSPALRRSSWIAAGSLALLATLVRVIYYAQVRSELLFREPTGDAAQYLELARRIAAEGIWAPYGSAYFQAPFYPWYLAALGGGDGLLAARYVQWFAGVLGTLLAWDTGRRIGGTTAGIVAGVLAALYAPRLFFEGELLAISWCLLFLQAMLWLLVLPDRGRAEPRYAGAGLFGGAAALAQPNALLAGVALLVAGAVVAGRATGAARRRHVRRAVAFGLGLALPLLPILARNLSQGGDWILVSSNSGINFFIGNNSEANGTFLIPADEALRNDSDGLRVSSAEVAAHALGGHPGATAVSGYWFDRGLDYWRKSPLRAGGLLARKVLYLLNNAELPNHYSLDFFRDRVPLLRFLPTFFPLALLGLWGLWRRARDPGVPLLGIAAAGYALSVVPFFVTDRYRLPLIAMLLPAAGVGFADLVAILRRRHAAEIVVAAATLAALAALTLVPLVDTTAATAHMHNLTGTILYRSGDLPAAAHEFETALGLDPRQAEARNNLGRIQLIHGDNAAAELNFREAIRLNPRLPEGWFNLEELSRNRADWDEAVRLLDGLETSVPGARQSFGATLDFRRGLALQATGDTAMARRLLSAAVSAKPDLAAAWAALAGIDRVAGRWAAARAGFHRAAGLSPGFWAHAYNLGIVSEQMGDYAAAESAYAGAARLAPALPEPTYRAAVMRMKLGRTEAALVSFRALADRRFAPAFYQLGLHAERQGRRDVALEEYRRAVQDGGPQDEIRFAAERLAALEGKQ